MKKNLLNGARFINLSIFIIDTNKIIGQFFYLNELLKISNTKFGDYAERMVNKFTVKSGQPQPLSLFEFLISLIIISEELRAQTYLVQNLGFEKKGIKTCLSS